MSADDAVRFLVGVSIPLSIVAALAASTLLRGLRAVFRRPGGRVTATPSADDAVKVRLSEGTAVVSRTVLDTWGREFIACAFDVPEENVFAAEDLITAEDLEDE